MLLLFFGFSMILELWVCGVYMNLGVLLGMQVMVELLPGLVFCVWAALTVPGKFLSVHPHSEENRYCYAFLSVSSIFLSYI